MRPPLTVGSSFGGYRIEEFVAQGGMAVVYAARHLHLQRRVALKLPSEAISDDPHLRERFVRESRLAASITHPNLVTVYDAGEIDGVLFIAMQYVDGEDLRDLLKREGRLPGPRAVEILRQVAEGLDAAHEVGLVHRDVKPSNVMIDRAGRCYLTDFGLARPQKTSAGYTATGEFIGTLHYAPPEQINGRPLDRRADIYALGCMAYEMLVGSVPFDHGPVAAVLFAHLSAPPPRASQHCTALPAAVDEVLARAMAKDPTARFPTAGELVDALGRAIELVPPAPSRSAPAAGRESGPRPTRPPPSLAFMSDEGFVGREGPLDRLLGRWRGVVKGDRRLVVLMGESGVGKTRLARRMAEIVLSQGARVLHGRCEQEALVPYQPFFEALRDYLHDPEAPSGGELDEQLHEISRLLPEARRRTAYSLVAPVADPEAERFRLFGAVAALLAHAARSRPLLLLIDDLQWADHSTALLLRDLLRHPDASGMLVIATFETPVVDGRPRVRLPPGLMRDLPYDRLVLRGFAEDEIAALVADRLAVRAPDAFLRKLQRQTDGNPYFIEETLRALSEGGVCDEGDLERALDEIGVPEGVTQMLERRLDGLAPPELEVLRAASVLGPQFDAALLTSVLDHRPRAEVTAALEEALRVSLIVEAPGGFGRYAFGHALVREAIYRQQPRDDRLRLHLRAGRALEAKPPGGRNAAELALHFYHARGLEDAAERAVGYCTEAGHRAAESLAYEDAALQYGRALEALPADADPVATCDLLLARGRVLWQAGARDARDTFLRAAAAARELGDAERLAEAALGLGERYWEANVSDPEYTDLLQEALAALPEADTPVRARAMARLGQNLHFWGRTERGIALTGEGLEMARRLRHQPTLLTALLARHVALLHVEHADERLHLIDEALGLLARPGAVAAEAHQWRLYDLFEVGDLDRAREEQARLDRFARELRQPLFEHCSLAWQGVWDQLEGRLDDAERKAEESYTRGRRANASDAASTFVGKLFTLRRDQGRAGELPALIDSRLPPRYLELPVWRAALTLALLEAGDRHSAEDRYYPHAAAGFPLPRDFFWLSTSALLAETCAALGDGAGARVLYERLLPHAHRFVQVSFAASWGSVERHLSILALAMGRVDAAVLHGEAAIERNDYLEAPFLAAAARRACASALRARGQAGDLDRAAQLERLAQYAGRALAAGSRRAAARALGSTVPQP